MKKLGHKAFKTIKIHKTLESKNAYDHKEILTPKIYDRRVVNLTSKKMFSVRTDRRYIFTNIHPNVVDHIKDVFEPIKHVPD
jgi:hypothetical protein